MEGSAVAALFNKDIVSIFHFIKLTALYLQTIVFHKVAQIVAAWLRENGERMGKWRENEEMERELGNGETIRKWRENEEIERKWRENEEMERG